MKKKSSAPKIPRSPKKKASARPVGPEILFTRDTKKRIPVAVMDAADLWLDCFTNIASMTAAERTDGPYHRDFDNQRLWLMSAAELADYALELYETRWPHMGREDRDK